MGRPKMSTGNCMNCTKIKCASPPETHFKSISKGGKFNSVGLDHSGSLSGFRVGRGGESPSHSQAHFPILHVCVAGMRLSLVC